jgi:hypothetical protein
MVATQKQDKFKVRASRSRALPLERLDCTLWCAETEERTMQSQPVDFGKGGSGQNRCFPAVYASDRALEVQIGNSE